MPRLSYDELDAAYRSILRQCAQERARADAYRAALLTVKGRLFGDTQSIDAAVVRLEREHGRHTIGRELDAIASADVRVAPVAPHTTTGDSAR